ncbi:protein adenylyltransferase SelO [Rhodococcus sp. IEGM 1408]|uniref:protein adenylyltransferase SelO n=1 Tax=Rhodococcus sp. IEGM 1408 TaxID=3082220 RepID=UPI002955C7B7|nr:YdiU family protein [Rhodococcus sp. IEGM 1408]MDV7999943.1 YdiU family protein [Rhodococcus sp. IEGM 1408]
MTTQQLPGIVLGTRYASEFPELAVPWKAAEAASPTLLALNEPLAAELGLDAAYLRSDEGVRLLAGNHVPEGATPVAQAYAGHQFGGYSPRLGDGRALLMGELADGRDLHLKGSGRTPFARGGDGLAAVGPMLREYLISEAMHALGVDTTRSLAVVATGNTVLRETPLPGAVLARVADSHLRVGTFQYARSMDDDELLRRLADHAIARHHPHAADSANPYLELFGSVLRAQADLVAQWMLIGFIHGVMNTDNTTISGETIDYGPCAFMEEFDPATVFSSIDAQGRYAYANQPPIMQWNLARFAETLVPLIDPDQDEAVRLLTEALGTFPARYQQAWTAGMRDKLGLAEGVPDGAATDLIDELSRLLSATRADFTGFFHALTAAAGGDSAPVRDLVGSLADGWLATWRALDPSVARMAEVNPVYIPRNHLVEEALNAATAGDPGPFEKLLVVVTRPYTQRPGLERYAAPAPPGAAAHVTYCGT